MCVLWFQFSGLTHAHIFPFPGLLGAVAVFTHVHSSYVMGFWAFLGKGDEKRGDIKKPLKGVSGAWVWIKYSYMWEKGGVAQ